MPCFEIMGTQCGYSVVHHLGVWGGGALSRCTPEAR